MRQSKVATDMPTDRLPRVGLARRLSKLGFCSRMQGFELVRSGRVAINGKTQRNPEYPVSASDAITVDDHRVTASTKLYLMMNKPRGLVTTASDDKGRPTVYSLLGSQLPWVAPEADSRWRSLFTDAQIQGHLDRLLKNQQDDGGWPIAWEPPSEAARCEWRGAVTLGALRTLTSYGRLTFTTTNSGG